MSLLGSYFEFDNKDLYQDETQHVFSSAASFEITNPLKKPLTRVIQEEINEEMATMVTGTLKEVLNYERSSLIDLFDEVAEHEF